MLIISLIFGFVGIMLQPIHQIDWWQPMNITNTVIGVEDFLFGFVSGGIAAVIYEVVVRKRFWGGKLERGRETRKNIKFLSFFLGFFIVFLLGFFVFKLNSLLCFLALAIVGLMIIYSQRRDLIVNSVFSGFLFFSIAIIIYTVVELITPGWVRSFWYFKNVPQIIVFNLPLDDMIWYLLTGAFIGPLYEWWQEKKLRDL